jgi:hypothetical protein
MNKTGNALPNSAAEAARSIESSLPFGSEGTPAEVRQRVMACHLLNLGPA